MDRVYAICSAAFFVAFGLVAVRIGTDITAKFVMMAFAFAALSQYAAQGGTKFTYYFASISVGFALLFCVCAILTVT